MLGCGGELATGAGLADDHGGRVDGGGDGLVVLGLVDLLLLEHVAEDGVAAVQIGGPVLGVVEAQVVRVLHDRHEARGLRRGEIDGGGGEVLLRRGFDPVGVAAVAGDVEVAEQDLLLRVALLEADRELGLLELSVEAVRLRVVDGCLAHGLIRLVEGIRDEQVLHELLGECRRTLGARAREVVERRAGDTGDVHAAVGVKALVLAGDGRVLRELGHVLPGHLLAVLAVDLRERDGLATLGCIQGVALGELSEVEVVGELFEDSDGVVGGHARDGEGRGDHCRDEHSRESTEADEAEDRSQGTAGLRILDRHRIRVSHNPRNRSERTPSCLTGSTSRPP